MSLIKQTIYSLKELQVSNGMRLPRDVNRMKLEVCTCTHSEQKLIDYLNLATFVVKLLAGHLTLVLDICISLEFSVLLPVLNAFIVTLTGVTFYLS